MQTAETVELQREYWRQASEHKVFWRGCSFGVEVLKICPV